MAIDLGTRIGADGKRHPINGSVPADTDEEHRAVLPIFGLPGPSEVPVWNATRKRLEWGAGGGGDTYDEIQTALAALTLAVAAVNDIPGRVGALETSRVSSTTITAIVKLTQAAYDAIVTPSATTLYVIVG